MLIGRTIKLCLIGFVFGASGTTIPSSSPALINGQVLLQAIVDTNSVNIPSSSQYINVLYKGVRTGTKAYTTLQQAIYLWIVSNKAQYLNLNRQLTVFSAERLIKTLLDKDIAISGSGRINQSDLDEIVDVLASDGPLFTTIRLERSDDTLAIFQDVYDKIRENHINADTMTSTQLLQGAIKGLAQSTKDPYTSYFPPTEAQSFNDEIQGEFFWIGAYIEMPEPGKLMIVAPIEWTPSASAGLLPWDQILSINNEEVNEDMDIITAISKIKWPDGTDVVLTLLRNKEQIVKTITRKKVILKPLTVKELSPDKVLISITMFQFGLDEIFADAIDQIIEKWYSTIVIDVRNNPGGSLDDVEHMLDYIVPKDKVSVIVKTKTREMHYYSDGVAPEKQLTDKNIVILINRWSASASEILAGVAKEYGTKVTLVWEKSFGKWTVQSIRDYNDGSSIKITIAKRLMGKSKNSIDKIGLKPDVQLVNDPLTPQDEVMEYVKGM